jgi:hypothetical protein
MAVVFGQTVIGRINKDPFPNWARTCPAGPTALPNGAFLICKASNVAWFMAPTSTQVNSAWGGGNYYGVTAGTKCCVNEWTGLNDALINAGFAPTQWFVPSPAQIQNPAGTCCANWGAVCQPYWSSGEVNTVDGCIFYFNYSKAICYNTKLAAVPVRAMRCVTY